MAWFSVYHQSTGRLESVTSQDPSPLPGGFGSVETAQKPNLKVVMWDETTRDWVTRPTRIWVDRIDDVVNDSRLSTLNGGQKNQLRNVLRELLGASNRWRPSTHPFSTDGEPPLDTPPES